MTATEPPRPISASTVVLLRDYHEGPQVLLLRRPPGSSFAARAYVFPGGAVDAEDGDDAMLELAPDFDAAAAAHRIGLSGPSAAREAAAFHIAAVREVFEESGVLMGRDSSGAALGISDIARLHEARTELLGGAQFADVLARHGFTITPELLTYAARFVTPISEPKRYDTRFFAALTDGVQEASLHEAEASEGGWQGAASIINRAEPLWMLPPTRIMCRKVAAHGDAASALAGLGAQPIDGSQITVAEVVRWAFEDAPIAAEPAV